MLRFAVQRNHHEQGHAGNQQQTARASSTTDLPIQHHTQYTRRIRGQNQDLDVAEAPGIRCHAEHLEEAHHNLAVNDGQRVVEGQSALGGIASELQHEVVRRPHDI